MTETCSYNNFFFFLQQGNNVVPRGEFLKMYFDNVYQCEPA